MEDPLPSVLFTRLLKFVGGFGLAGAALAQTASSNWTNVGSGLLALGGLVAGAIVGLSVFRARIRREVPGDSAHRDEPFEPLEGHGFVLRLPTRADSGTVAATIDDEVLQAHGMHRQERANFAFAAEAPRSSARAIVDDRCVLGRVMSVDESVAAGVQEMLTTFVVPAHEVWRCPIGPANLNDLTMSRRVADLASSDGDLVSNFCSHCTSFGRGVATRDTLLLNRALVAGRVSTVPAG